MSKPRKILSAADRAQRTESVLEVLEAALEYESDADATLLEGSDGIASDVLPAHLRDPFVVLERGRELLRQGLPLRDSIIKTDFEEELRIAARNGVGIPDDIRARMIQERAASEAQGMRATQSQAAASSSILTGQDQLVSLGTASEFEHEAQIEELATLLVSQWSSSGKVDLERIAESEGITFSFGHYRDCFDGLLECRNRAFHIYINVDSNKGMRSARARFSFAHELGHYFLDWHRAALHHGVPPHGSKVDFDAVNLTVEREADMFAAHLLLPAVLVRKNARHNIDAAEIVRLSQHFCTSLTATAIRCARLGLAPLIVMRWAEAKRAWCWSSADFEKRTGNRAFRSTERLPADSLTRQLLAASSDQHSQITSKGTTLATWFPNVRAGSSNDDILVEECVSLGAHGVLTILRPA